MASAGISFPGGIADITHDNTNFGSVHCMLFVPYILPPLRRICDRRCLSVCPLSVSNFAQKRPHGLA